MWSKPGRDVPILPPILERPGRLLRTVRHLRAGQIVNRLVRRFRISRALDGAAPERRPPVAAWVNGSGRRASMLSETRFRFVGHEGEVRTAADWNDPARTKLWLYNLHYFDDLRADDMAARGRWHGALMERWLTENPPRSGNGWEPYPLSLRIVNWIGWDLAGNRLSLQLLQNLAVQVRALGQTLEFHLLGNHLLANAKALIFAGCFFSSPEADGWLRAGLGLLTDQLDEQILSDGGHFELSPMYHAIILEDVLDLIQLSKLYPRELEAERQSWKMLAGRMMAWLADMTHPDGEIAFFNDAAFGIARTHAELAAYARLLDVEHTSNADPLRVLGNSGYLGLRSGPFSVIFDAAEIGPRYLPGHGHADVLSLEACLDGRRLLSNGGTSSYADDMVRNEERSTAAHGTVEIDGHSSSEVWGSFRVGRRAHPFDLSTKTRGDRLSAAASHDGYRWLPGKPVHRRHIAVSPVALSVTDRITGTGGHSVVGRFPLHPSVSVSPEPGGCRLELAGGRVLRVHIDGPSNLAIEEGHFSPTFGQRLSRPVLVWRHDGRLPVTIETRFEL